jgi:hypothetical protein
MQQIIMSSGVRESDKKIVSGFDHVAAMRSLQEITATLLICQLWTRLGSWSASVKKNNQLCALRLLTDLASAQPGQSGNPTGRPKGAKSLGSLFHPICNETVRVKEGNRHRRITKLDVGLRHMLNKAASGDLKAIKEVMKLYEFSDAAAFLPPITPPPIQVNFVMPQEKQRVPDDQLNRQSKEAKSSY